MLSSDPSDAIQVWVDKDGCICDARNPYQCFDGRGYLQGTFTFLSKQETLKHQKFTVNANGTIGMTDFPEYVLGTDPEAVKAVKLVKNTSEHKFIFQDIEKLRGKEIIRS